MKAQRLTALLALLLGLVVMAFVLACGPLAGTSPAGTSTTSAQTTPATPAAGSEAPKPRVPGTGAATSEAPKSGVPNPSGLPEVRASELPVEARETLALIATGGPFPYSRDGATFGNFERILPRKSSGYYKEYTVRTPGESDRGARRIVAGQAGEKYYTPDHYNSFRFILEGK